MKVSEVMTAQVVTAKPKTSVKDIARMMSEIDSGVIPIAEDGKVLGLVTDRDIVVRVVGRTPTSMTTSPRISTSSTCSSSMATIARSMRGCIARPSIRPPIRGSVAPSR